MNARDYNLVIDGNHFVYSRLYVLPKPKQIPGLPKMKLLDEEREVAMFIRKLSIDFASELRKLKSLTRRVILTYDARSWRKDSFPEADYKGNREEDETINWPNVRRAMEEFAKCLAKQGVITQRVPGSEGDDLVFGWVTHLNSIGENCIIWSGDKDLIQLVNYNRSTDAFTIWYDYTTTRKKVVAYPGFQKWLLTKEGKNSKIDIFGEDTNFYILDQVKDEISNFIKKNQLEVEEVFCDEFVLQKILMGDKGDNVKSVCLVPTKNGSLNKDGEPKMNKVNDTKADKIISAFKKRHNRFSAVYLFDDTYKDEICNLVSREMKVTGRTKEIKRNLELNINLILLHVSTIPDAIQKSIFDSIKTLMDGERELIIDNLVDKDRILKDTPYISTDFKKTDGPPKGAIGLF